ncbi:hypothetical protein ASG31_05620 [Chryseobacterium sp. Leaf404]|uniref:DUF3347 domain-containing protein n=1 Tax=unclassified Chryseobacterium TaxID=2593645 RepID=UPI0006FC9DE2|nr:MULTISPECIES: DUF3347 domain-containing protein [unclassified Chryseobacterium]KQT18628.1 hypothetical protein ASG31_05620 [Chryseobacterium sp. Leaf404]
MKAKFLFLAVAFGSSMVFAQSKKNVQVSKLYQNYIVLKNALASDSSAKAAVSASEFLKTASGLDSKTVNSASLKQIKDNAQFISASKDIKVQRAKFQNISDQMLSLSKTYKLADKTIYLQYCPMADAAWLSNEAKIINPYYGSSMLNCGKVQQEIK